MTTPNTLFSRILSLAIQGKLVDNSADEDADALLSRIKASNTSKKKTSFDPIKPEECPFQIPDNWKWVRLGEICETMLGKMLDKAKNTGEYVDYIGTFNIQWFGFDLSATKKIRIEESEKERFRLKKGDLVVCEGGDVGRAAIWDNDTEMYYQKAVHRIRSFGNISQYYLLYLLLFYKHNGFIDDISKGVTIKHFTQDVLQSLPLPLPPLSIQSRIVSKLNEIKALVDECVEIEADLDKNAELLRKKVLDKAIRGRLTTQLPSDGDAQSLIDQIEAGKAKSSAKNKKQTPPQPINPDDQPFQIPGNWKWVRLGEIKDIWSAKRVMKEDWKSIGVPFYRAREITKLSKNEPVIDDLFITEELYNELKSKYGIPQKGDIMLSAVGTIGKAYVVKEHDKFYFKDASVICLSSNNDIISSDYMKLLFDTPFMDNQMHENSFGTTVDTITISTALTYLFPLPPLAEQSRIVAKIEEVFAQIDNLRV